MIIIIERYVLVVVGGGGVEYIWSTPYFSLIVFTRFTYPQHLLSHLVMAFVTYVLLTGILLGRDQR